MSECDLNQACHTWYLQAVVGQEIWHWTTQFEKFTERKCSVFDGCAWEKPGSRVVFLSP